MQIFARLDEGEKKIEGFFFQRYSTRSCCGKKEEDRAEGRVFPPHYVRLSAMS